jgi:hypothetical protein
MDVKSFARPLKIDIGSVAAGPIVTRASELDLPIPHHRRPRDGK